MAIAGSGSFPGANLRAGRCEGKIPVPAGSDPRPVPPHHRPAEAKVVSDWRVGVRSDGLAGTVERKLEEFERADLDPQPVRGSRAN